MFNLEKGAISPFFCGMKSFWGSPKAAQFNFILFLVAAVVITIKLWLSEPVQIDNIKSPVAAYNNFLIFKWSGFNLVNELPLYISNDPLHYDLFKYSPTCALAFLPFYWPPTTMGLLVWNLVNMLLPLWALHQIIGLRTKTRNILALFLLAEGVTSLLNAQSNGLVLGLLMMAIGAFQREKTGKAILLILASGFIKIFGWIFFLLFLLRPKAIPKGMLFGIMYGSILLGLPLLFVSVDYLVSEYRWWFVLLGQDSHTYVKLSFMGWLQSWFGFTPPKNAVLFLALFVQMIPLWWRFKVAVNSGSSTKFSLLYGSSLLLWVVLFNHMSESATYVIAVGGMAIFFSGDFIRINLKNATVLAMVLLLTILGPTDLYPREMRYWIVESAQLKAFPVLVSYVIIWYHCLKSARFNG